MTKHIQGEKFRMLPPLLNFLRKFYSLVVVAIVFLCAFFSVMSYREKEAPPGTIVLRFGHWQLETGVRDALNEMAREYQKLHPNVRIVQDAVPDTIYGQWLSTQFMGNTAPDIVQVGKLPAQQMLTYYNRYCLPLSEYVNRPNPYNNGNEFENTSLRQTYKDGMRSGYVQEMQEYMSIPLSQFTTRIFYNKNLLKELTGLTSPPKTYREFLDACRKIKGCKDKLGRQYAPIVGSTFHFGMWTGPMADMLTYELMDKADFSRDGFVGNDELYVAIMTGLLSFKSRPVEARFQMIRELADNCQPGFTGLGRDEGVFMFAQQRAVFITTGTWDARSLMNQCKSHFDLGIMDYPIPGNDDPKYGDVVKGPRYENPFTGFPFSVVNTGLHKEQAIDFLLFISAKSQNEKLNRIIGWIPVIIDAEADEFLKDFKPRLEGTYSNFNPVLGGNSWLKWEQLSSLYNVGQISYNRLVEEFEPYYKEMGLRDFKEQQRDWRRAVANNERFIALIRAKAFEKEGGEWIRYRSQSMKRLLFPEINHSIQMSLVEGGASSNLKAPYEYSPETLEKVKAKLAADD